MKTLRPEVFQEIQDVLRRNHSVNPEFDRAYDRALTRIIDKYQRDVLKMSRVNLIQVVKIELRKLKIEILLSEDLCDRRKGINAAYFFVLTMLLEFLENEKNFIKNV